MELYKDNRFIVKMANKNAKVYLYKNTSNEDKDIYFIEVEFFIKEREPDLYKEHKLIICNQYFNFAESDHDKLKSHFWEFYDLLAEGDAAFEFFINEMEKHRR